MLGSTPALSAGADATFRVRLEALANALQDAPNPLTDHRGLDTGPVPIGPLPDSLARSLSAHVTDAETWGTAITSSELELKPPGPFVGAVLRGSAVVFAFGFPETTSWPTYGQAYGRTEAVYSDSLTPSGLPYGTPVSFRVRIRLDGVMDRSHAQYSSSFAQLTLDVAGGTSPVSQLFCTNPVGPCNRFDAGTLVLPSGVPQAISLELVTEASATSHSFNDSVVRASSDFGSTASLCIDALTAGATYVLESGGDLSCFPSIPAVPALSPLAVGLLAVAIALAGRPALRPQS